MYCICFFAIYCAYQCQFVHLRSGIKSVDSLNMYWLIAYLAEGTSTKRKCSFEIGGTLQYRTTSNASFCKIKKDHCGTIYILLDIGERYHHIVSCTESVHMFFLFLGQFQGPFVWMCWHTINLLCYKMYHTSLTWSKVSNRLACKIYEQVTFCPTNPQPLFLYITAIWNASIKWKGYVHLLIQRPWLSPFQK
jgi:hypothetical protein